MSSGYNDRPLAPFAGILSLGIGDTMVSLLVAMYYYVGVHKCLSIFRPLDLSGNYVMVQYFYKQACLIGFKVHYLLCIHEYDGN